MSDYDYDSYEKCLEKVLESVQKDYWAQYIDINRHQVAVGRTYLWVAVALIGAYAAFYQKYGQLISSSSVLILALAFILAVLAFGICLYAMPARKGYSSVHKEGWGEFSHTAYKLLSENAENIYAAFLTEYIAKFDIAQKQSVETNQKRAKLLRSTSWMLIISFVIGIIGLSVTITSDYTKLSQKGKTMTESNDSNTSTASDGSTQPTNSNRPNVPIPPPPAGSPGTQLQTHSEKPALTRCTDSTRSQNKKE